MKMKRILGIMLALVLAFSFASCKPEEKATTQTTETKTEAAAATEAKATEEAAVEVEPIKIGVLVPLTGTQTQAGVEVMALCQLFEDAINNVVDINLPFGDVEGLPNLGGAKVEFVYGDLSTPDIALAEAERLITEEGVIGLAGNFSSSSTKTTAVATEKYGAIILSEGTSVSLLTAGYQYYGRTYPNDNSFVDDTFNYLDHLNEKQDAGITTVALVCEDSEFGTNIAITLRAAAEKFGYTIAEDIKYSAQASNVTSEVLRLKAADPDVVIMSSYIADALLFMTTYKEQGYFPRMLFGQRGGFTSSDFMINLGEDADYCFTTSRWNTDFASQVSQDMAELYKSEYSNGITLISDVLASAWDAYLLAIIANQAGTTDVDAMRAVMAAGVEVDPDQDPTGLPGYIYGPDGQNSVSSAIVVQMMNGEILTVYPENVAATEGIYPAPGWSER